MSDPRPATALAILEEIFGYPAFRGRQAQIIDAVIAGRDCLVLIPTGGGKALCYQIPALLREGTGIVVSPLISLMRDQVAALKELGVRAAFLNSTLSAREANAIERSLVKGELDLTIGNSILPLSACGVDGSSLQLILRRRASLP